MVQVELLCLDLVHAEENAEVVKLSKDLRNAFTVICQPRRRLSRRQLYVAISVLPCC